MTEVMGGGVVLAVAAALWLVYLMPTWMSRRQYLSTERNAVRLQQTLRILAETSEVPREVRLEATARDVAAQQRLLRSAEERARLEEKAADDLQRALRLQAEAKASDAAATARAAEQSMRAAADRAAILERASARAGAAARRRVRRSRALSTLVLLASVIALFVGGVQLAAGGTALVLGLGFLGGAGALVSLSSLARVARVERGRVGVADVAGVVNAPVQAFVPVEWAEARPTAPASWTPQPLPRPLYLQRGSAAAQTMDAAAAAAELRAASVESERALRVAALASEATPITRARPAAVQQLRPVAPVASAPQRATASRFASMGVIGDTSPGQATDLDAVLRRRRASA